MLSRNFCLKSVSWETISVNSTLWVNLSIFSTLFCANDKSTIWQNNAAWWNYGSDNFFFFSKGVAWATRVSPNTPNQIIESAKELLLKFIPDVYIASDHSSKEKSGKSSGFGLVLTAETKSGTHYRWKAF